MASGALFGNASGRSQSKNLVEFRAGKMTLRDKLVTPDKRKGLVYVYQSDDSLMHFCWKDRTTGTLEDDLIIFPDDIEFKHLPQCTTGRAYLLKFKNSPRKYFYWLQEPKTDKDEENCRKVNDFLNHPPTPGSNRSTGGGGGLPSDLSGLGDSELQNVLSGMSQQQLMQLLGGGLGMGGGAGLSSLLGRPSSSQSSTSDSGTRLSSSSRTTTTAGETTPTTTRPATATATTQPASTESGAGATGRQQIQLSDLQNILSSINVPPSEEKDKVDLSQALNPEAMIPILANPDIQKQLVPYLPEGETLPKTEAELRNTIQSPQFQQALSSFSSALQSGDLGPLMTQFGLGEDVANAAAQGDMEAFVKAMQDGAKKDDKGGGLGMGGGAGLSSLLGRPSSSQSSTSDSGTRLSSSSRTTTTAGETTPTTTRPATASATTQPASTESGAGATGRQQIQLSDLQNILSSINVPPSEEKDKVDLSQALNPEAMIPILANPDIQKQLVPYLPEGETLPKTEAELRNTIQSPQFQQALSSFSSALQSGDLGPLMTQFGLGEDVANAAAQGDMEAFVKAMQDGAKKDDKGDEKMEH